jgi:hypothetical protein
MSSSKLEKFYADSELFISPKPENIPLPTLFLSDIKYCSQLNTIQKKYIRIIKENWKGEIKRLKSLYPIENNEWLLDLKNLDFMPNIMKDICFLLKQGVNPAEPEIVEWRHKHLISDYCGGTFYSELGEIVKKRFIKSIEYINNMMDPCDIPFKLEEEEINMEEINMEEINMEEINNEKKFKGGGNKYNFIVNPETGRRVIINGKKGVKILKKYLEHYNYLIPYY